MHLRIPFVCAQRAGLAADKAGWSAAMKAIGIGRLCLLIVNSATLVFLLAPMAIVFAFAINPTAYVEFPPVGFSLRWFEKFFASREFIESLTYSLRIAAIAAVLSMLLGASAAIALSRSRLPGRDALTAIFLSPLMIPAILTGLGLFQMFLLMDVGRPAWGLILGHTIVCVPYVLRTTLAILENFDRRLEEAALNLGAGPIRTFFEVTLPIIRPGIAAGTVFAFVVSFDQFPISLFLVEPGRETFPIRMFNYLLYDFDGTIAAASIVSISVSFGLVFALDRIFGLQLTSSSTNIKPRVAK